MTNIQLFTAALGLQAPWSVSSVDFQKSESSVFNELHIRIVYQKNATLDSVRIHDHIDKTWEHLNFFQHRCYIHCSVPRVYDQNGKVKMLDVPWARSGSGFTLLFEAFALTLLQNGQSMSKTGKLLGVDGKLICRIMRHYVEKALLNEDLVPVRKIGIDETSVKKGHQYMTVVVSLDEKKVIGVAEGRDEGALAEALGEAEDRGAEITSAEAVSMDLSPAYTAAVQTLLPDTTIVYDRFHLEQMVSKAVDEVRKIEASHNKELRKSKYIFLRNESRLTKTQSERLHYLQETFPSLGAAHRLKEQFKEIWKNKKDDAKEAFDNWIKLASESAIVPMKRVVSSFKTHMSGIMSYFDHLITSGFVERVNLTIQEIKRIAKGYRNFGNYKAMIYLRLGKLNSIPHWK
jgi:transposase